MADIQTSNRLVPNRPVTDDSRIPSNDKDLLSYAVAFNIPNQKAFALWHPEFLDSSGKLNKTGRAACTQFFNYSKNREYADSYAAYLKEFLSDNKGNSETHLIDVDESRKDKALKSLLNQAMSMVESGDTLDPDNGWHYDATKNLDLHEELTKPNNQNNETDMEH